MGEAMSRAETKRFDSPDESRAFPNGKVDLVHIGAGTVGRFTVQPGWRWSKDVKPIAKTDWCEAPHFQYVLSGTMRVRLSDGTEFDVRAGDVSLLGPGHDAWVVGDEPVIAVDWSGATNYATR